ncbi:protein-tyrosine-phosphatase [Thiohalobacter thiocyanaticus]|uniref:protein-tyrosine-phosphatase n=1 Tax=Thiohalobacter thiocyanaticus TaxID=585455 RepID=A0A1Z4VRF5_9GAMM|nr:low molecular weight protein-tyrosine-phosphatase [Thiohalobacter thiocyanaticus]BAZ94207.1 protein-tyrosine-phosphatase [Thiohalobacter thiocyanaticus]
MIDQNKVRVLFVCMGNICRSPTAQGVFEKVVDEAGLGHRIEIHSAGTHAYHVGEPPDTRAQEAASKRGYDLSAQRARKVQVEDFIEFDYVLAMDRSNYADLQELVLPDYEQRLKLFLEFARELQDTDVPDPYYGGRQGFERVLDLIEAASQGLLEHIRIEHKL